MLRDTVDDISSATSVLLMACIEVATLSLFGNFASSWQLSNGKVSCAMLSWTL